jgi:hypothetical protein
VVSWSTVNRFTNVILNRKFTTSSFGSNANVSLTNTLPGRDGYDIEIFGMEGVPTNALAEWKARKEAEAGTALSGGPATQNRPRHSYNVIPEADLHMALIQHKALMAARDQNPGARPFQPPPPGMPGFPPMGMPPPFPGYVPITRIGFFANR